MSHGSYDSSPHSVMTEDEEDWEDYVKGGYHPVHIGDTFSEGRYVVVRKLGWGHFSTVWLARDNKLNRHVALKVVKSAPRYTETALDEIKLLQRIISSDPLHPGRRHVIGFLDHFRHKGPNGSHVCMVFEVLGENLLGLIRRHQNKGVPMNLVKQIAKQILLGLDYMHRSCGIIHTDLKPENILVCIDDVETIIRNELTSAASAGPAPTKLVGVPPSRGRGGNQTPRSESIFITGSQPLPSPSSSYGTSPVFDRLAFGMSKIKDEEANNSGNGNDNAEGSPNEDEHSWSPEGDGISRPTSGDNLKRSDSTEHAIRAIGNVSLNSKPTPSGISLMMKQSSSKRQDENNHGASSSTDASAGPSNADNVPLSTSAMSIDTLSRQSTVDSGSSESRASLYSEHERITVKIADLGNATWIEHHFTDDIQTRQYRCPEVILGAKWGPTADMWSVACLLFELITGGDYLFDPAAGTRYNKDDDHMAQIIELIGEFPKVVAFAGKYSAEFFNRKGELRRIQKLRFWPLEAVLSDKYLLPRDEAEMIASFLTPMMRLHPDKRARASELTHHSWLDGVLVQGEIDLIRRAEEEELRKREAAASRRTSEIGGVSSGSGLILGPEGRAKLARAEERINVEAQIDMDALKPVDESLGVDPEQGADGDQEMHGGPSGSDSGGAFEEVRVSATQVPTASAGAKENLIMKPAPTGRTSQHHHSSTTTAEGSNSHSSKKHSGREPGPRE